MIENEFLKKRKINESEPVLGKWIKRLKYAETVTNIAAGVAVGVTILAGVTSFGIAAFVPAAFAGVTIVVTKVYKQKKKSHAKENIAKIKRLLDVGSLGLIKDVARELSRIFEYQLLKLKDDDEVRKLAKCAVSLMLDLKEKEEINRNTLIRNVLQDGKLRVLKRKKKLKTVNGVRWFDLEVFRNPGLRRTVVDADGVEFECYVKENSRDSVTQRYGYRGEFVELKNDGCQEMGNEVNEGNGLENQLERRGNGTYFCESGIDQKYNTPSKDCYSPVHVLLQCPDVLDCILGNSHGEPSLANFLKTMSRPPGDRRLLIPVYRQRKPGRVPSMTKIDLTGSDFSHADFTDSHLKECTLTDCVMLFAVLERAKMSCSIFNSTFISHSNLLQAEFIDCCTFVKTKIHHSRVNRAVFRDMVNGGEISYTGTNVEKASFTSTMKLTFKKEIGDDVS